MKYSFIFLFQFIVFSACGQNKEAEITLLETEMVSFFQGTLEENYGQKDAIDLLVKGMERYHFNYLLEVDKERLKQINKKLYSGWLYSYFLDGVDLNDSCAVYVSEKYASIRRPVFSRIFSSQPSARSSSHRGAVRRHCQTIALYTGRPVSFSQTIVVSRWLVMPTAAMSAAERLLVRNASESDSSCV